LTIFKNSDTFCWWLGYERNT